ncbi:MAG: acyl-CoA dehydrogenase family protein [Chitinophagales bacterium]|jgi:alkylation response protein AidB-like acyl-CoA dehydrogenase|nr:acyl-CoA dehydrogenase family protein [Chitinophagales bacterium]MBP9220875.1 acyl-CoA dehydrogenase family protein [Chitinophagales bacterium]
MAEIVQKTIVIKGGEFLIKDATPQDIFIPEELNEEQLMIKQMTKDFVDTEVLPNLDRIDAHEEGLMPALLTKAGEIGILGLPIPEQYGGFNKDFNTISVVTEMTGTAHAFSVAYGAQSGIGTLPILYFGTEAQKQKYLPGLASGKLHASYCLTEPGSGSDALAAKSKAELSADGKHYILNGQKMWITNAGFADIFTVFAKVDGDKFTAFIVERNTPGFTIGAEEKKMGIKGSSTCQIFFENMHIPVENVLGEIGKGHLIAFNILNIGRYKLCVGVLGGAKELTDISVKYANERMQFNVPISSFGAIKYKMSEQAIRVFAALSATYRTSDYIDKKEKELMEQGVGFEKALLGAAEEYAIECAMLKVIGSEVLDYVVDECVQIYGGNGYSEEYPAARSYRDARINRIFEGTNEINRLLTVDMLLKRVMKGQLDMMGPAMAVQKELMAIPDFASEEEGLFTAEEKTLKNMKKAFFMVAGAAVQKLMMKLKDEQEILMCAADMMNEIYVSESLLLRVKKLTEMKGENETAIYRDILKVFFTDSIDRLSKAGKTAIAAFTEGDEQKMMLLGLKRFSKYEISNTTAARRRIADKMIAANGYCF